MPEIDKIEKDEFLFLSACASLKEDMRKVEINRKTSPVSERWFTFDESIKFLSQINAFANHKPHNVREIKGHSFIL